MVQEIDSIETINNIVKNTVMQMVEATEMEMEANMERVVDRFLPMSTETVETLIGVPTSSVNKEGDN